MSKPRDVRPGTTYLLSRCVVLNQDLLVPSVTITEFILYALAFSAMHCGIRLHALCALPTQIQLVVTDVEGKLPQFLWYFHTLVALGTKRIRKWKGVVWEPRSTCAVPVDTREVLENALVQVLGSPVAAGLVQRADDWSGAKVVAEELGRGMLGAARPEVYFNPRNELWPEEASLGLTFPPWLPQAEAEDVRRAVAARLTPPQEVAAPVAPVVPAEVPVEAVFDAQRATGTSPTQPPKVSPWVVLGAERKRVIEAAQDFNVAYRAALAQWCEDARDVLFPPGTWWMRVFHGARVGVEAPTG